MTLEQAAAPTTVQGGLDPVTLEIIHGALESAIREMEALVDRTAMSAMIKEKKDRFVGMYDAAGRMIAAHVSFAGPGMVDALREQYPPTTMESGDLYWFNDPYFTHGAIQHLGDMCFVAPVFADGRVVAFAATYGHFRDIGGSRPGSISPAATEIFQEGIRIPPIRIVRAGVFNDEAYRLILANSRFPLDLEGDTKAMIASSRLGESRLVELFERFGTDTVLAAFDRIVESTAVAARARLREIVPEGTFEFFDYVDSDGHGSPPIRIGMRLIREGDRIVVDISDSGPQTNGPVNFITTHSFINLLFGRYLMAFDPELRLNEGLFQIVDELRTRPGTIVDPRFPAATGLRSHTRLRLSSVMLGIMAQATGGQSAANSPVYCLYTLVTHDPETGVMDFCNEGVGSGLGARPYADGVDVIYFVAQQNFPVEFLEREHALRVERYEIEPDSGGPGRFRGGTGVRREVRTLQPGVLNTRLDNVAFPCWGANGGQAGRGGTITINTGTSTERQIPPIGDGFAVEAGDVIQVITPGGGGWGDPFERPIERVREDVVRRFVTLQGARVDYGVVLDPITFAVDVAATERLRSVSRPRLPMFDRGIATGWLREHGEPLDLGGPARESDPAAPLEITPRR
jgi:N-methylhydantoinase B